MLLTLKLLPAGRLAAWPQMMHGRHGPSMPYSMPASPSLQFTQARVLVQGIQGRGTADDVARILTADLPGFWSLFIVTAVMAPLLEETVFRGFFLPSLTK